MPPDTQIHRSVLLKSITFFLCVVVLVIAAVGYVIWTRHLFGVNPEPQVNKYINALIGAQRTGSTTAAEQLAKQIVPSNPDQEAMVALNSRGAAFRQTGETSDLLNDVTSMKLVFSNTSVSPELRVEALDALMQTYDDSGNDPSVLNAIFSDQPYSQYLVPGDPLQSMRKLAEWSYGIYPTSLASAQIGNWYATQAAIDKDAKPEDAGYIAMAEKYYGIADSLATKETAESLDFLSTSRYMAYRSLQAQTEARFARINVSPYTTTYSSALQDAITLAASSTNVSFGDTLPYLRFVYAHSLLTVAKDSASSKEQLDVLATEMDNAPIPNANSFIRFIRNSQSGDPRVWSIVQTLEGVSPAFKAEVGLLTASSTSAQ